MTGCQAAAASRMSFMARPWQACTCQKRHLVDPGAQLTWLAPHERCAGSGCSVQNHFSSPSGACKRTPKTTSTRGLTEAASRSQIQKRCLRFSLTVRSLDPTSLITRHPHSPLTAPARSITDNLSGSSSYNHSASAAFMSPIILPPCSASVRTGCPTGSTRHLSHRSQATHVRGSPHP